jgi:hypothetical protein
MSRSIQRSVSAWGLYTLVVGAMSALPATAKAQGVFPWYIMDANYDARIYEDLSSVPTKSSDKPDDDSVRFKGIWLCPVEGIYWDINYQAKTSKIGPSARADGDMVAHIDPSFNYLTCCTPTSARPTRPFSGNATSS